ncbi:MAG: TetR/AcrR family transcriptional regulator [Gemmatimonadaceae bacterium]|nr:TetR/AcrR family transcriptional regulator [Gemmatimonadaceae bacterium]
MHAAPKSLPASERRSATVDAVVALAALHNPSEITTTAIARQMGLTQGALFKHFPTKDAVLQSVMEWVADSLLARVDKAVQSASSPLNALESLFLAHVQFVASHPGVPRIVFSELQRAKPSGARRVVDTLLRRYSERVSHLIRDAKVSGEVDEAIDAEAAAVLFVGTIQGLVMQSLMHGDASRILRDAPRVFVLYRRGIERAV